MESCFLQQRKAPHLCEVCSRVPAWLGCKPWDEVYYRDDPPIVLKTFVEMRAEVEEKGPEEACHLCQIMFWVVDRNEGWRPIEGQRSDFAWINTPFLMRRWYNQYNHHYEFICENMSRLFVGECSAASLLWQPRHSPLLGFKQRTKDFNINLMKDWLENCQRNHPRCQPRFRDFLPTRLLDLEAFSSTSRTCSEPPHLGEDIRLVSSDIPGSIPSDGLLLPTYVTLSHCWGPPEKRPTLTTKQTLAKRKERIPFADLPKTFQDAVDVTRQLGQRYLWIDSLCIIQDDEDDWGREAGLMSKVYSKAYCTLAALSAGNSTDGLTIVDDVQASVGKFIDLDCPIPADGYDKDDPHSPRSFQVRIWAFGPRHWELTFRGKNDVHPLPRRAWTLQERLLSRSVIFFGEKQLLWECRWHRGTAELPWFGKGVDGNSGVVSLREENWNEWCELKRRQGEVAAGLAANREKEIRWWALVRDYAGRLLTKQTDKLAALSGVARLFQNNDFPDAMYVAGMWSSHLPNALRWSRTHNVNPVRRTSEYVAPSWSWASIAGPVNMDYIPGSLVDEYRKSFVRPPQRIPEEKMCDELKVEEINIVHKYDDLYGPLKDANLVLSGARLVDVELITEPFDEPDIVVDVGKPRLYRKVGWSNHMVKGLKRDGFKVSEYQFDVPSEEKQSGSTRLWCLAMWAMDKWMDKPTIGGLLLREEGFDGNVFVYSRLGTFNTMPFALFESVEPRRIKLI